MLVTVTNFMLILLFLGHGRFLRFNSQEERKRLIMQAAEDYVEEEKERSLNIGYF